MSQSVFGSKQLLTPVSSSLKQAAPTVASEKNISTYTSVY